MQPPAAHGPDQSVTDKNSTTAALARRLLLAEARAITDLADSLLQPVAQGSALAAEFERAVGLLEACSQRGGSVLVTGLGKSGLIGQKISATLASLGLPSHFIHPVEAAHGDLGNFRATDLCIALSNSGETDEVLSLVACLRQDGIDVIGICAGPREPGSGAAASVSLQRLCTACLCYGRVDESFAQSPAPMCSTTASIALGDALALCASARLRFTHADFAKRHPGGSLGGLLRPISEAVRFVTGKNLMPVSHDLSVEDALRASEIAGRRPGAMLLVEPKSGKLSGIFTDADLRRLVLRDVAAMRRPISEFMTRSPSALPDTARVADAVHMVQEFRRDEIPVVDAMGKPVGMLDVQDLVAMRLVAD